MPDLFAVAESPFELQEWQDATGIRPDFVMTFESWSKNRSLKETLDKAKYFNHSWFCLTWEPWQPVPVGSSATDQGCLQPTYSHEAILNGDHDEYIDLVARSLRDSGLTIYLRLMHEMNGTWYPWHHDPDLYVECWKYIRNRVRSMRGAWNVQFVWSPNPDLWRASPADWLRKLMPYWPGTKAVEFVGFTMIEFGGGKHYPVSAFAERFDLARQIFKKELLATEVNVAHEVAVPWLNDLTDYVGNGTRPLLCVVLSQGPSRAEATGGTGNLSWNAMDDTHCRDAIKGLVAALHRA